MVEKNGANSAENGNGRLDGWKEIAAHLRCNVRTAIRWEKKLGLPVLRLNKDAGRSKVIAFKSELDKWLAAGRRNSSAPAPARRLSPALTGILSGGTILALAAVILVLGRRAPNPIRFEVKGQSLVFYDSKDRNLWPWPLPVMEDQTPFYADVHNVIMKKRPRVAFKDIDEDGRNEVAAFISNDNPAERAILLFDHNGREIWKRFPGFEARYLREIPSSFIGMQIGLEDINGDGKGEILVLWGHARFHPGVFEIFSTSGDRLFHYDHTGILQSFVLVYEGAGRRVNKILLGGTNSLLGGDAVLIVLDPSNLQSGLGPPYEMPPELQNRIKDPEVFTPVSPSKAGQTQYIRFPQNSLSLLNYPSWMNVLEMIPSDRSFSIQVQFLGGVYAYYVFDPEFRLTGIDPGSDLPRRYPEFYRSGRMKINLDDFLKERKNDVWNWNGTTWMKVPFVDR
jgi:hypothetical protein